MTLKIIKNCIPTVFSLMLIGLYSVIDGLFIGRSTGDVGLAAINIAWPITALVTAIGIGIGNGGSVLLSNYLGRKKKGESERIYHNTVLLMIISGLILTVILFMIFPMFLKLSVGDNLEVYKQAYDYCKIIVLGCTFQLIGAGFIPLLRNMNMIIHAMVIMILGMLTNLSVNYYTIFELGLGISGAALGTIISQFVVGVLSVILIYGYKRKEVKLVWNFRRVKQIIKTGFSSFGVSIAPSVTLMFTNMQCLTYGGESAVACYAAISYIVFPVQSMLTGVGEGVQPMISYYNGSKQKKELQTTSRIAKIIAIILGVIAFIAAILLNTVIPKWFGLSLSAQKYFASGMIISSLAFLILGVVKFNNSYLTATLQIKKSVRLIYGESLIISPLLLWVLPFFIGIKGIWLSLLATNIIMLVVYNIYFADQKDELQVEKQNLDI